MSLADVLEPAAALAEDGFPVSPITAYVRWVACDGHYCLLAAQLTLTCVGVQPLLEARHAPVEAWTARGGSFLALWRSRYP